MKYSIIIPTYNHCEDLLKPCIESILRNSTLDSIELVISANGCTDSTHEYLNSLSTQLSEHLKVVWSDEALGYTKATNLGIKAATGEYVILMNNDIVVFDQEKDYWLKLLEQPFSDPKCGMTGPVKFSWDCGGAIREAMAFWLVMTKKEIFDKIGYLDEIYSPGMGEDGDFSVRLTHCGYNLVSVPNNVTGEFDVGVKNLTFPVFHVGNGTFADDNKIKNEIIDRNNRYLATRWGKQEPLVSIVIPHGGNFHNALKPCIEAILKYTNLIDKEIIVVANGAGNESKEFLEYYKEQLTTIWFDNRIGVVNAYNVGLRRARGKYVVMIDDDSILLDQAMDIWIQLLMQPFLYDDKVGASSPFAHEYEDIGFLLHSGCTMYSREVLNAIGGFDEEYRPGYFCDPDCAARIWKHGYKCIEVPERNDNKQYKDGLFKINFPVMHTGEVQTMNKHTDIELVRKNRERLYKLHGKKNMKKFSIVIPTYNHCDDLLKPCIDSIEKYSLMDLIEVVIVANGCTDNTKQYFEELSTKPNYKLIWSDEALGYTKATNLGIKAATGEYVVLLNNDTELLPQFPNQWLDMMEAMFKDPKVGMTGPLELFDRYANYHVIIFFCAMIKREVFDKLGLLDEIYSPGGGEDIEFTVRMKQAGYKVKPVSAVEFNGQTNIGNVPIYHKDNQTFKDIPIYRQEVIKKNGLLNCIRFNKDIRLNLGAGGIEYDGFLSVDKYDARANVPLDITKLTEFKDSSVSEIMASHVFEHLNPYHSVPILQEWLRVLKPGGKLAMEMPDIEKLCQSFLKEPDYYKKMGILNAVYGSVNTTDVGGPDEITSPHLFGWWPESLFHHLSAAGYTDISFPPEQWPHPCDNLRVEAYKPTIKLDHSWLKAQEPATFIEIFEQNGYGLELNEVRGKTVVDIGGNLGMFSLFALELGANRIVTVEAQPVIYEMGLKNNVTPFSDIITPLNYAAASEDGKFVHIMNQHVGSKVGGDVGELVETITLQTLLDSQNILGNDLILKLDCEGSEFDVLIPAAPELLRRFSIITLEIHGNTNSNPEWQDCDVVRNKLAQCGFQRAKYGEIYAFNNDGSISHPINVFVEKWVRV